MAKLHNQRRERMAQAIFRGSSAVAAYKAAGFQGNARKNAAKSANARDRNGRSVKDRVAELNRAIERKLIMEKTEALEMLTAGARQAFRIIPDAAKIDAVGTIILDSQKLTGNPELLHAIKEVVQHVDGRQTIRVHSYRDFIESLSSLQGWDAPKRWEGELHGEGTIKVIPPTADPKVKKERDRCQPKKKA